MRLMRIIISALFAVVTVATAVVFIGDKITTDKTLPTLTVEGELIEVELKATDEDLLRGVTAFDEKDGDLTGHIIVESVSRFTEKGVCKVTYAVCDSDNHIAKATRSIRYKGYKSPRFKVEGNLCFSLYENIDIRDMITASDSLEGDISSSIVITSSSYSSSEAGVYSINVSASNKKGDVSTIELPFIVEDRPLSAPVIELSEYLIYCKKNENFDFKGKIVDALDSSEASLKGKVTIESDVNFKEEGTYHVHYYVTDSNGFRGHSVLTVIVGE